MFSWDFDTYGKSGSYCASDLKSGLQYLLLDFEIICAVSSSVVLNLEKYFSSMMKDWKIKRETD